MVFSRIVSTPDVLGGAPRIRDTRISVSLILELMASGASQKQVLEAYPHLEAEDIREALLYASRFTKQEVVVATEVPE